MKKIRVFLICTLLLFSYVLIGQEETRYIEVTGVAEMELTPDEIFVTITIRERESGKDRIDVEKQEKALKEALEEIGIPLSDLNISDANASYVRISGFRKGVVKKVKYFLKVKDAETLAKVFEKLDEIKITGAYVSRVNHSKITEYRAEVRTQAIKAAKAKADYLLNAIGEETGKALVVLEKESNIIQSSNRYRSSRSNANTVYSRSSSSAVEIWEDESSNAIEFNKIKLRASIYVKFEIKDSE